MLPATASAAQRPCAQQVIRPRRALVRSGRPVPLEPMSASERSVVHEHLKERHDVETYSEGEEPSRRLVVAPISPERGVVLGAPVSRPWCFTFFLTVKQVVSLHIRWRGNAVRF